MSVGFDQREIQPSPSWGGLGGGASSAPADDANNRFSSTADAAGPPPASPTRGEEKKSRFKRLNLAPDAVTKARRLRRDMTDAERTLWRALRETFPDSHWRKQVPLGSYFADFCSHSARVIIEVDGGQHSADRDAARDRFLAAEGYGVLRFWNNDVLGNLDGVLATIEKALPLVGRVGWGPDKDS